MLIFLGNVSNVCSTACARVLYFGKHKTTHAHTNKRSDTTTYFYRDIVQHQADFNAADRRKKTVRLPKISHIEFKEGHELPCSQDDPLTHKNTHQNLPTYEYMSESRSSIIHTCDTCVLFQQ